MTDSSIEVVDDISLDKIQLMASAHLKKILLHENNVKTFQSNVSVLMDKYRIEKSYFDALAIWYGNRGIWTKTALWSLLLGTAAGIGYICNFLIVLSLVALVLYGIATLLLSNHVHVLNTKDGQLVEGITTLESSLAGSVEHLSEVEKYLKEVFASLYDLNIHQVDNTMDFKVRVDQLDLQVDSLSKFVKTAEGAAASVSVDAQTISDAVKHIQQDSMCLGDAVGTLEQKQETMQVTIEQISAKEVEFDKLKTQYNQNNQSLLNLSGELKKFITQIRAYATTQTEQTKPAPADTLSTNSVVQATDEFLKTFDEELRKREQAAKLRQNSAMVRKADTEAILNEVSSVLDSPIKNASVPG